jgi:hypothetical protein
MDEGDAEALRAQIAALTAAVQALSAGRAPAKRADPTIDEIGRWYLRTATRQAKATLVPFLRDFGGLRVSELTKGRYIAWRGERAEEETIRGAKRAVGSLNLELAAAQALLRAAVKAERIDENPLEGLPKLRGRPRGRKACA